MKLIKDGIFNTELAPGPISINSREIETFFLRIREEKERGARPMAFRQIALALTNNFTFFELNEIFSLARDLVDIQKVASGPPLTLPVKKVEEEDENLEISDE
jgi:hypothetical protein